MPQSYADFINQAFKNPDYLKAQSEANTLAEQAPDYLARKQAELRAADPALQALTDEKARLRSQLYSAPATGQNDYRDILDPIKRQALISQSIGNVTGLLSGAESRIGQRQGTQDQLAQRAYDAFRTQLEQKQGNVKSMQETLKDIAEKGYAANVKASDRKQSIQDEMNMYLFKEKNKSYAPSDGDPSDITGFVSMALDNADNTAFDFNAFLQNVPSKIRGQVVSEYQRALSEIGALTPEQQDVTAEDKPNTMGAIGNFFKGIKAPKINIPNVPNINNMSPQQIINAAKKQITKKTPGPKRTGGNTVYQNYLNRRGGL